MDSGFKSNEEGRMRIAIHLCYLNIEFSHSVFESEFSQHFCYKAYILGWVEGDWCYKPECNLSREQWSHVLITSRTDWTRVPGSCWMWRKVYFHQINILFNNTGCWRQTLYKGILAHDVYSGITPSPVKNRGFGLVLIDCFTSCIWPCQFK